MENKLTAENEQAVTSDAAETWDEAFDQLDAQPEYARAIMQKVEDWRAGKLKTVTLEELEESLGLNSDVSADEVHDN